MLFSCPESHFRNAYASELFLSKIVTPTQLGSRWWFGHGGISGRVWYHSNRLDERILLHPILRGFHMRRRLGFAFFFENIEYFWVFQKKYWFLVFEHSKLKNPKISIFSKKNANPSRLRIWNLRNIGRKRILLSRRFEWYHSRPSIRPWIGWIPRNFQFLIFL